MTRVIRPYRKPSLRLNHITHLMFLKQMHLDFSRFFFRERHFLTNYEIRDIKISNHTEFLETVLYSNYYGLFLLNIESTIIPRFIKRSHFLREHFLRTLLLYPVPTIYPDSNISLWKGIHFWNLIKHTFWLHCHCSILFVTFFFRIKNGVTFKVFFSWFILKQSDSRVLKRCFTAFNGETHYQMIVLLALETHRTLKRSWPIWTLADRGTSKIT